MDEHILYLSYDGMTDPLGQSQVLPYLTMLRKKSYNISMISLEKLEVFTENPDTILDRMVHTSYRVTLKEESLRKKGRIVRLSTSLRQNHKGGLSIFKISKDSDYLLKLKN